VLLQCLRGRVGVQHHLGLRKKIRVSRLRGLLVLEQGVEYHLLVGTLLLVKLALKLSVLLDLLIKHDGHVAYLSRKKSR